MINQYEERVLKAHADLKINIANRVATINKIDSAVAKADEKIKALTVMLETVDPILKSDLEKLIAEQQKYIEHAAEWKPREGQTLQHLLVNEEFFKQHICPHVNLELTDVVGKHRCLVCNHEM